MRLLKALILTGISSFCFAGGFSISPLTSSSATITTLNNTTLNSNTGNFSTENVSSFEILSAGANQCFTNIDNISLSCISDIGSSGTPILQIGGTNGTNIVNLSANKFVTTDGSVFPILQSFDLFGGTSTWTAQQSWTSVKPSSFTALYGNSVNLSTVTISSTTIGYANLYIPGVSYPSLTSLASGLLGVNVPAGTNVMQVAEVNSSGSGIIPIGKTAGGGFNLGAITGTANQITVTNGDGSITLGLPANITVSTLTVSGATFSSLGSQATNGSFQYCSDCTVTTPATCVGVISAACVCAGSGSGAFAKRLNATWYCN